jgi:hypothetical protein
MQNPYAAERKKQHYGTRNKGAFKRGSDFLAFIQMRCNSEENRRGANRVNHHEINNKGSDKIFDHILYLLIDCVCLSAG